ncbi:MAG: hypothetical protein HW380_191 [Magnetococcales bacterium]|nr:hypothetical protein [Magnetococcales bacterium]HIJ85636.1 hypothetical protein [Magnetococcales bacterium]
MEDHPETPPRYSPVISRSMLRRFIRGNSSEKSSPLLNGRGYVREGEGVSAEEMDRRTMKILEQW